MTRSTDTLTKSTATDYKKMNSNGSIESMDMDKSVLSDETSYDIYDTQNETKPNNNQNYDDDILQEKYDQYSSQKPNGVVKPTKVYGVPQNPQGFELAYRNEGYRSYGGTRNNSVNTVINDESPIIHQTDDAASDYYGNSSTLPLRTHTTTTPTGNGENLKFLKELKNRLPEYEPMAKQSPSHSSFLPSPPPPPSDRSSDTSNSSNLPYDKKIDRLNFNSPTEHNYHTPQIRRPDGYVTSSPQDIRRPDSYYTAVRSSKAPNTSGRIPVKPPPILPPPPPVTYRPKTVYESSGDDRPSYSRSKSEALLETNFDGEDDIKTTPLTADHRSHSQPLETAM